MDRGGKRAGGFEDAGPDNKGGCGVPHYANIFSGRNRPPTRMGGSAGVAGGGGGEAGGGMRVRDQ